MGFAAAFHRSNVDYSTRSQLIEYAGNNAYTCSHVY